MPRHAAPSSSAQLVLVIDDDPAVLNSLKFSLEIEGFAVRGYGSSKELLERPVPQAACFVVDYRLPAMDGLALVAELRRRHIRSPVILITTNPPTAMQRQAVDAGLTIVEKPLLGNALAEAIRNAVRQDSAFG